MNSVIAIVLDFNIRRRFDFFQNSKTMDRQFAYLQNALCSFATINYQRAANICEIENPVGARANERMCTMMCLQSSLAAIASAS